MTLSNVRGPNFGFDKADISRPFWELWLPTIHGVFACVFATWIHPCAKGMDILPVGVVLGDMVWDPKHPLSAQHQHAHATSLNVGARLLGCKSKNSADPEPFDHFQDKAWYQAQRKKHQESQQPSAAHVCLYLPLLARSICNYHVLQNIACVTFSRPKHCPPTEVTLKSLPKSNKNIIPQLKFNDFPLLIQNIIPPFQNGPEST